MNKFGKIILSICGIAIGTVVGVCLYEEVKFFKEYFKHLGKMEDEVDNEEDIFVDEDNLFYNKTKEKE